MVADNGMRMRGKCPSARVLFWLLPFCMAADPTCSGTGCAANQDAPEWSGVMIANDGVTEAAFFLYASNGSIETAFPDAAMAGNSSSDQLLYSPRPSRTYLFADVASAANANGTFEYGATPNRTVCYLPNLSQNFGDYSVSPAVPLYPGSSPQEFNESRRESGIKGISVYAGFAGNVIAGLNPAGNAIETFYYSDSECTAGGHEYGFMKDVAAAPPAPVQFYISDHTNCDTWCNSTDGIDHTRYVTYSISNLSDNSRGWITYYFSAYFLPDSSAPNGYLIRVQIVDPFTWNLETCADVSITSNESSTGSVTAIAGPCTFDITPPAWYRADLVNNGAGYLFGGYQLLNNPDTTGNSPGVYIDSWSVGK